MGADIVIHLDPWWNIAAENQATDRAHRIGQTNVVQVIKIICQDSIEQKVLELQEIKKDIANMLISSNDDTNGPNTQGVVIHDVDVTAGPATATVAFMGVIDMAKMDSTFTLNSKVSFPHDIIYMKGRSF